MKRPTLPYTDLLGLSHRAGASPATGYTDCLGVSVEALRRAGFCRAAVEIQAAAERGAVSMDWDEVPSFAALEVGDVIVSEPSGEGRVLHVAAVISRSPLRAISSCERTGVFVCSPYHMAGILGMYRPPREDRS